MLRLVHKRPEPVAQIPFQVPSSRHVLHAVQAFAKLRGADAQARQDGDDRRHDEGPSVADDEHAHGDDDVLDLVLRDDVAVPDARERRHRPIVGQTILAEPVLLHARRARVTLGHDQLGHPRLAFGRVAEEPGRNAPLSGEEQACEPMATHRGEEEQLHDLDRKHGVAVARMHPAHHEHHPVAPGRLQEPGQPETKQNVGAEQGVVVVEDRDPPRQHDDQVHPGLYHPLTVRAAVLLRTRIAVVLVVQCDGRLADQMHNDVYREGERQAVLDEKAVVRNSLWVVQRDDERFVEPDEKGGRCHEHVP
mmetsp:Transcript_2072/g.6043  ORF Transcript_2072/g.6043 Transcript_2072/m.6043 type:complete len:306 (+) Transcript_2072:743-1660(+)